MSRAPRQPCPAKPHCDRPSPAWIRRAMPAALRPAQPGQAKPVRGLALPVPAATPCRAAPRPACPGPACPGRAGRCQAMPTRLMGELLPRREAL